MSGSIGQALVLIINSLGGLFILAILLRFMLQAARADFYNPVTQAIVKVTSPVLVPFRKIIPGYRGFDFAALVLALVVNSAATAVMILAAGYNLPDVGRIVSWALVGLLSFTLKIYFYALLVSVIASWIAPFSGHPVLLLIYQILDPLYKRVRRVIPPLGGLDFSPLFIFLGIQVVEIVVVNTLAQSLRMGGVTQYVIGI